MDRLISVALLRPPPPPQDEVREAGRLDNGGGGGCASGVLIRKRISSVSNWRRISSVCRMSWLYWSSSSASASEQLIRRSAGTPLLRCWTNDRNSSSSGPSSLVSSRMQPAAASAGSRSPPGGGLRLASGQLEVGRLVSDQYYVKPEETTRPSRCCGSILFICPPSILPASNPAEGCWAHPSSTRIDPSTSRRRRYSARAARDSSGWPAGPLAS